MNERQAREALEAIAAIQNAYDGLSKIGLAISDEAEQRFIWSRVSYSGEPLYELRRRIYAQHPQLSPDTPAPSEKVPSEKVEETPLQILEGVRRLYPADAEAFRVLRLRGLDDHPLDFGADARDESAWTLLQWRERLRAQRWYALEREGSLIGCGSLRIPEGRKVRHNGWVHAMYVAPEARGAGAADAVLDCIEREARAASVTRLKLNVHEGNARAIAFYRRRGFESYGREPDSHVVDGAGYASLELCNVLS
jgi:ribosomal protein S18 acetylase RimI-like enzyme